MRPLRVAIFHASLPAASGRKGGVEATVDRLARTLAREDGVEVTVFSCGPPPAGAPYRHRSIWPHRLDNDSHGLHRKFLRHVLLPFSLNFVDFRTFDVVHLHGDDWFWFRRPVPTIRTMHGSALREAQSASRRARRAFQYAIYPLEHLACRLATRSVAIGQDTQRIYGTDALIGVGVDLSLFKPREKTSAPSLLFIGLWNGRKRGNLAFRTFVEEVLPRQPGAQLHMVCDWAPQHRNVRLYRDLDDAALATLFAQSWAFLCTSSYEGFGIPYIEALASGTAIVAARNPGAVEVLRDGRFGVICEDGELGARTCEVLEDATLRGALEHNGLERAREFSVQRIAANYLALYRELA